MPLDVVGVRIELPSKQPVVVLRGAEPGLDNLHVAVLVGPAEANAIAMAMEKKIPPRPMTHDLLAEVMTRLGSGVRSVEIGMLDSSTYRGTITLVSGRSFAPAPPMRSPWRCGCSVWSPWSARCSPGWASHRAPQPRDSVRSPRTRSRNFAGSSTMPSRVTSSEPGPMRARHWWNFATRRRVKLKCL